MPRERTPDEEAALERTVSYTAQLLGTVFSTAAFYLELAPDGRPLHVVESRRAREHLAAGCGLELTQEIDEAIELRPAFELLRVLRDNLQLVLSESADARAAAMPAEEMSLRARPVAAAWKPVLT